MVLLFKVSFTKPLEPLRWWVIHRVLKGVISRKCSQVFAYTVLGVLGHSPPLRTTAGNATTARQFFCLFVFLSFCLFLRYLLLKMENAIFFKTIDLYIDISMKVILKQKMVCINF